MASSSLPPPDGLGPFQNLGFTEWLLGAAWVAGSAVVYFVSRLSSRMSMMETKIEERHEQNKERSAEVIKAIDTLRATFEAEMRQQRAQIEGFYRLIMRQKDSD